MINNLLPFLTYENIYLIANWGVMPFWLLLIILPNHNLTNFFAQSIIIPLLLSSAYIFVSYNIFIEGKSIGTVSNSQGEFILDIEIANNNDSIIFSYMGYENFKISTKDIEEFEFIYLRKSLLKLPNVSIYAQNLSVKDIIKLIETNYIENYPQQNFRSKIFFHNYLNISFSKENELKLKKSNFEMLNKELVSDVFKMIPKEIIQYQDAIINVFSYSEKKKDSTY